MSPTRQLRRDLVRVEGSASAAGGGITMALTPVVEAGPGNCCGRPRRARSSARGSPCGRCSRVAAAVAGALLAAGSAQTRFGVFDAGMASSKDPKYIVLPQRARMAARHGQAHAVTR